MTTKDTKSTKSTKESENKTFDAIFQLGDVEVDQQSDFHARQFHVRQQLSLVDPFDLVNALELNDQLVFDQNVNSVPTIEPNVFVLHRLWTLELEFDSVPIQFMSEALFVGGFKEPGPQLSVHFDGTADHGFERPSNSIFVLFVSFVVILPRS